MSLRHPPDRTVRPEQVVLAHDFAQPLRSQTVGERRRRLGSQACGFEQIGHGAF